MHVAFETIRFFPSENGIRGLLLKYFRFQIPNEELQSIGPYKVEDGNITFDANEKKRKRFNALLAHALRNLTCTITKNPAIYIDAHTEVPLMGALEFGIIDRGTNVIEIRPCSGCNLACIYCSVHEGPGGPKKRDIVIQKEYLLQEFDRLAQVKTKPMEIFIETQGEPLLYDDLPGMIHDLKARDDVKFISMVTNGTFFTEQKIDALAKAGLDRINWSINSLDPETATKIAGVRYDVERIKRLVMYAKDRIDVLICPVIMKGINENELEDFVEFAAQVRKQQPVIGFQNFLYYKGGRNPVDEIKMDAFTERLREIEKNTGHKLVLDMDDFHIEYDNTLPRPFRKKQIIEVEPLFPGRLKNETMCKADGFLVKVIGRIPNRKRIKVQLIRDKHNIFVAKPVQ